MIVYFFNKQYRNVLCIFGFLSPSPPICQWSWRQYTLYVSDYLFMTYNLPSY